MVVQGIIQTGRPIKINLRNQRRNEWMNTDRDIGILIDIVCAGGTPIWIVNKNTWTAVAALFNLPFEIRTATLVSLAFCTVAKNQFELFYSDKMWLGRIDWSFQAFISLPWGTFKTSKLVPHKLQSVAKSLSAILVYVLLILIILSNRG